jgi:hypothetical protein
MVALASSSTRSLLGPLWTVFLLPVPGASQRVIPSWTHQPSGGGSLRLAMGSTYVMLGDGNDIARSGPRKDFQ